MQADKVKIQKLGSDGEKVRVTETIEIPQLEMQLLYQEKDSEHFELVACKDDGYSNGYDRSLIVARKKGTEAYYRFLVIAYTGYANAKHLTFTKASRVFPITTTYTRESYTTDLDTEKDAEIIRTLSSN